MPNARSQKNRKPRNTKKQRVEKKRVLIALEDTKSSKYYFEKLVQDKNLSGEVIFAKHIGTDPENVVKAIVSHLNGNKVRYEKKWIVIDKDDYLKKQINGAIQTAMDLDICVAISNEAYELWILLHFTLITAHTSRDDLKKRLYIIFKKKFNIEYAKASRDVYQFTVGLQKQAIINSKKLVNSYIRDNGKVTPFSDNPLTTVYQLVEYLNTLYDDNECNDCFPKKQLTIYKL